MTLRSVGGLAVAILFLGCIAVARADSSSDACWQLVYHAVERSAEAPHARYISYGEAIGITQDGHPYERASANITYRDDGVAYIDDDRWVHPFLSGVLEPGPPVLGPYADHRASWLSLIDRDTGTLPVIADTHNAPTARCTDQGNVVLNGASVAHILMPDASHSEPALKSIWIDRTSFEVKRAIVSQWLTFVYDYSGNGKQRLIDYSIDIGTVGGYEVVQQIDWRYTYPVYGQYSTIAAEFRFTGFQFNAQPPVGTLFAAAK